MNEVPSITEKQASIIRDYIASEKNTLKFLSHLIEGKFPVKKEEDIRNLVTAFVTEKFEVITEKIEIGDWVSYSVPSLPEEMIEYGEVEGIFQELGESIYQIKDKYGIPSFRVNRKLSTEEKEVAIEEEIYRKIHNLNIDEKYYILEKIREIRKNHENKSSGIY